MRKTLISAGTLLAALTGCDLDTGREAYSYKITEEGAPKIIDEETYPESGWQTFGKTQKYRIALQSENKKFHYLILNVTQKLGGKTVESNKGQTVPIIDGIYDFECQHGYSIKLSESRDVVDNPVCDIDVMGVITPNADASVTKGG